MKLSLEQLEDRCLPAASAFLSAGVLSVFGTAKADVLRAYADAAGQVHVSDNGTEITIKGNVATRASVQRIDMYGYSGDDVFITDKSLDTRDANGVLVSSPDTRFFGGRGADVFLPGNGGIVGGAAGIDANGNVVGRVVGNNLSDGGPGNDVFVSGPGNDTFFGGSGNDSYTWPPGTLTDTFLGGAGTDSAAVIDGGAGNYTLQTQGNVQLLARVTGVRFSVLFTDVETLGVQTNGTVTRS